MNRILGSARWGIVLMLGAVLGIPALATADTDLAQVVTKAGKITLGAEIRARYENRYNHDFSDATPNSSDFTLLRTRLNVGMDVVDDVKAFIQVQDSRIFGAEQNEASNDQNLDLHQAGSYIGALLVSRDITEQKRLSEENMSLRGGSAPRDS